MAPRAKKQQKEAAEAEFAGDLSAVLAGPPPSEPGYTRIDVEKMSEMDLLLLRSKIDSLLPAANLQAMNMQEELIRTYQTAKALLDATLSNDATPANQKAQVTNTCSAILQQVTGLQTALYNAERVKAMETALERTFKDQPMTVKEAFFAAYERALAEYGVLKVKEKSKN